MILRKWMNERTSTMAVLLRSLWVYVSRCDCELFQCCSKWVSSFGADDRVAFCTCHMGLMSFSFLVSSILVNTKTISGRSSWGIRRVCAAAALASSSSSSSSFLWNHRIEFRFFPLRHALRARTHWRILHVPRRLGYIVCLLYKLWWCVEYAFLCTESKDVVDVGFSDFARMNFSYWFQNAYG